MAEVTESNVAVAEEHTTETQEQTRFAVAIPDKTDLAALQEIYDNLEGEQGKWGVIGLRKWISKYLMHVRLTEVMWTNMQRAFASVNGTRTATQKSGDKKRSLHATAQSFYESLSTSAVRMHCNLFKIDYDAYESMEEVIAALVAKHTEMIGSN